MLRSWYTPKEQDGCSGTLGYQKCVSNQQLNNDRANRNWKIDKEGQTYPILGQYRQWFASLKYLPTQHLAYIYTT